MTKSRLAYKKKSPVKERVLKRIFDISVSAVALVVLSPLFFLIAVLLKLEGFINASFKGPIFFREIRVSRGKLFAMYKFRTVKRDVFELLKKNKRRSITEFTSNPYKHRYLTSVGAILVQIYFDELPQLLNVIKGDISLVGPRPHIPRHYQNDLRSGMDSAKYIKTGMMGPVQASKGNPALKKTFEHMDKRYGTKNKEIATLEGMYFKKYLEASAIEMLFYDIWIIYRCVLVVLKAQGL